MDGRPATTGEVLSALARGTARPTVAEVVQAFMTGTLLLTVPETRLIGSRWARDFGTAGRMFAWETTAMHANVRLMMEGQCL
mmetsp:Transcript_21256/g.64830  ORF Transcript_21256/g.64830 Transcript_21256/m.64830 type:complete len:82 (+) Transcript_21256:412-657(+)